MSKLLGGIIGCKYRSLDGISRGSPMMGVSLGQQFNIGEKPTVILYTYINCNAGTPEKQRKQKHCSTSSNIVVMIYCYIGCEDEVTTWYYSTQLIEVVNTYNLG